MRCSRVCKDLMDMSLDNLWEDLGELKDLVEILVSLRKAVEGMYWVSRSVFVIECIEKCDSTDKICRRP